VKSNYSILAVKAYDVEGIAKALADKKKEFVLLTLQNGFKIKERILKYYTKVISGLTYQASTFVKFGNVIHTASGLTLIEEGKYATEFERMLNLCELKAKVVSNINYEIWKKLIVNSAINPLSCITRLKNGELIEDDAISNIMKKIIKECVDIANSLGLNIKFDEMVDYTWLVAKATADNKSSMLQDIEKGKITEIDFINGEIVRMAKSIGKRAVFNEIICDMVHDVEKGNEVSLSDLLNKASIMVNVE
jgi:2-dehydropantoate 2-reductase